MKRFHFPLQPVVVLRAHGELRAREAFGAATLGVVRAQDQLAAARRRVPERQRGPHHARILSRAV